MLPSVEILRELKFLNISGQKGAAGHVRREGGGFIAWRERIFLEGDHGPYVNIH